MDSPLLTPAALEAVAGSGLTMFAEAAEPAARAFLAAQDREALTHLLCEESIRVGRTLHVTVARRYVDLILGA